MTEFKLKKVDFPNPPRVIFVLGGPGSGKGTQCQKILDAGYGFWHLSAGDALREEQDRPGSQARDLINQCIKNGVIVPYEVTITLLQAKMMRLMKEKGVDRFLIDGFPRKLDQARAFEDFVTKPEHILFFRVSDAVLTHRLLERGKTSGRADDNVESVRKRLVTFHEQSMNVVKYYECLGMVRSIAAEGSVEEVWEEVKAVFQGVLK